MIIIGLFIILAVVLIAPFSIKWIEEELEGFLFVSGCIAVTITSQWSLDLVREALVEPLKITFTVLIAGFVFGFFRNHIGRRVNKIADFLGLKLFAFLTVVTLGFLSSVITAIIAALFLVEIITHLSLDRKNEIRLVVLSCFSIGLGASLTPIGEPLSTIAVAKLKGAPYNADFLFLFRHLGGYIIPGIIFFGLLSAFFTPPKRQKAAGLKEEGKEGLTQLFLRVIRVYFFVVALIFLGNGFRPLLNSHITVIPYQALYWLNTISAILDNATLAACEIGPNMTMIQIKSSLLGLLIAGGLLVPGNIPNIICAKKLKIKSAEWAKFALPLGLSVMAIFFFLLLL